MAGRRFFVFSVVISLVMRGCAAFKQSKIWLIQVQSRREQKLPARVRKEVFWEILLQPE